MKTLNEMTAQELRKLIAEAQHALAKLTAEPKTNRAVVFVDEIKSTRYNGGWTKSVTGLNKNVQNGYSILGEFVAGDVLHIHNPGLYLDKGVGGSRKHPDNYYILFSWDGENVHVIRELQCNDSSWAIRLWDDIDEYLNLGGNNADN